MQLERARAELRSRPPFEAMDMGVRLLRTLALPALRAWLLFVLPLQLLVLGLCSPFDPEIAYLVLWWLKPVYERPFGLILGHGLFGDPPSIRAVYRGMWRDGRRALLGDLSWRRLDPARSFVAPVALLEGIRGEAARRRRRTLSKGSTGLATSLVSACFALELSTTAGLVVGAQLLLPDEATWIADTLGPLDPEALQRQAVLGCYTLVLGLVGPLFVASGFGLYINRRTDLEGWDIEIRFRRMARRLTMAAAAALLLAFMGSWPLTCAQAQEPAQGENEQTPSDGAQAPSDSAQPQSDSAQAQSESALGDAQRLPAPSVSTDGEAARAMARVLARPELQRAHREEHWELRQRGTPSRAARASGWLGVLADLIANGVVFSLWAAGAAALVVVLYLLVQRAEGWRERLHHAAPDGVAVTFRQRGVEPPLALRQVVPRARALWRDGQHAAALSLLYVATLQALVQQDGLHLPDQATEGQCVAAVQAAAVADDRRALFVELTRAWQLTAYAHAQPDAQRLEDLCSRFSACFGTGT